MTPRDNPVTRRATRGPSSAVAAGADEARELRGMLRILEQLGYDLDALLASAGLERHEAENLDFALSPAACATILAGAHRERRVPNLPLQLARLTPVGATPLLDYLIVSSDSVGHGLERL